MERLLKTPFCSALGTSVSVIQCALLEFSYCRRYTALLGCRRSCFAFVQTVCQPLYLTEARTAAAKPSGQFLYVERLLTIALYYGYPIRRGKSGSRWPLTSVSTLSQKLDCIHFVSWEKLYVSAQTHQKPLKKQKICTVKITVTAQRGLEGSLRGTFPLKRSPSKICTYKNPVRASESSCRHPR